jgi:PPE-repeat protein
MVGGLDFAVLPPEVNSARMYAGAGVSPMLAAASAWNALAAELRSTALSYGSVLSGLTGDEWHGPASAAMAAAAAPYVAWMATTAEQAEQTAGQAEAAAAAYEVAFAATVAPPVIAANRATLAALAASNVLGQNSAAIAAIEAQYLQMWAQDAAAMYGYAASSATATQLSAFSAPRQTTNGNGVLAQSESVAQAAASSAGTQQGTLSQLLAAVPNTLQGLANPVSGSGLSSTLEALDPFASGSSSSATGISGLLNMVSGANGSAFGNFLNANIWNTVFSSGFFMPGNFMGTAADFAGLAGGQATQTAIGDIAASPLGNVLTGPLGNIAAFGNSADMGLGKAALVGPLSVPPSWTAAAPLNPGPLANALGSTPMIAPEPAVSTGMPAVPMNAGMTGQGFGRAIPQYGFRPNFVARPPSAG